MKRRILALAAWTARRLPLPVRQGLYRWPPLARLIRSGLNRIAPPGLTPVAVAAGELAGMKMLLDLREEKDYWLGTYEAELQASVAGLVLPGMVAYDVGANIGFVTLLLARRVGEAGRVFAFEALPDNLERLRRNLTLNGLDGRVEVIPAAVADATRSLRFLPGPSGGTGKVEGSAGRQGLAYQEAIPVQGIALDDFVFEQGHPQPDIVKIDIEGGEVLALPGMWRLLKEARPVLLLELHGRQAAEMAWETLGDAGYRVCRLERGFPRVDTPQALDWKAYLAGFPSDE